jgi:hypothetical protein
MADGTSPQNAAALNAQNSMILRSTGLYMTRKLMPVTATSLGGQVKIPLERTGVVTGVLLKITVPVNVTAAATASNYGPYSFVNQIQYTDFAGLQRVNTNGYLLHTLSCFKGHKLAGNAVNYSALPGAEKFINTNITNVPTAVAASNLIFFLYVPLAYDPRQDLRGAVLAQAIYGEHYLTLQLPSALVGTDPLLFPYTAGTVALNGNITVQAYMNYIMPQSGANNLPLVDLSTIYAIEGNMQDSSNITVGADKYLNWPNNRAILSAIHVLNQGATGGTLNETDVNTVTLLGNSNTNIKELTPDMIRYEMRYMLQADMASGVYYLPSRSQPITTQLYGNVQTKYNIATAGAGTYFLSQFESTYLSGTPLPGVIQ